MSSCEQGRHVRLEILPDAGGKIARLHDQKSGRNWLWSNPHIPFNAVTYDADFGSELGSTPPPMTPISAANWIPGAGTKSSCL
jgi:hypothetical protein